MKTRIPCSGTLRIVSMQLLHILLTACIMMLLVTAAWHDVAVRIMAALSLAIPHQALGIALAQIGLCGAVLALPYLVLRRRGPCTTTRSGGSLLARVARAERRRLRRGGPLPYCVAIAAGAGPIIVLAAV
jgi:prepilin peptidase CpaA